MPGRITLVCILTGQPIPNLLSVHHVSRQAEKEGRPFELLLCATQEMAREGKAENFKSAMKLSGIQLAADGCREIDLGPGDQRPEVFCRKLTDELNPRKDAEVVLNITGGTKMITLGAYEAANQTGSTIVYVPEGRSDSLQRLDGKREAMDAKVVGVRAFMAAYGCEVTSALTDVDRWERLGTAASESLADELFPTLQPAPSDTQEGRNEGYAQLRKQLRNGGSIPKGARVWVRSASMRNEIERQWPAPQQGWSFIGEFIEGDRIDRELGEYLTGGWLEALLFSALRRRSGEIGVHDVSACVKWRRNQTSNELDIAFMRGTTLCTVECKSGSQSQPGADPLSDLYKAEALLHPLRALHTGVWYATTAPAACDERGQVRQALMERANLNRWTIIPRNELRALAQADPGTPGELAWLRRHFGA